jgi:hypothetical protein
VTFDHADGYWPRTGLPAKDADQRAAVLGGDIHTGEVVKAFGRSLVDRQVLRAVCLDNVAEGSEGFFRQGGREELQRVQGQSSCASWPNILIRLTPPSGKIFSRICVIGPIRLIADPSKS